MGWMDVLLKLVDKALRSLHGLLDTNSLVQFYSMCEKDFLLISSLKKIILSFKYIVGAGVGSHLLSTVGQTVPTENSS